MCSPLTRQPLRPSRSSSAEEEGGDGPRRPGGSRSPRPRPAGSDRARSHRAAPPAGSTSSSCPREPGPPPAIRAGSSPAPTPHQAAGGSHRLVRERNDRRRPAASATLRASVPTVSRPGARSWTPRKETSPLPGFSPTTPQTPAGIRTEPPVWECPAPRRRARRPPRRPIRWTSRRVRDELSRPKDSRTRPRPVGAPAAIGQFHGLGLADGGQPASSNRSTAAA